MDLSADGESINTPDTAEETYGPGNQQPCPLHKVIFSEGECFFECPFFYEENGYDFRVKIMNFGLRRSKSAGGTAPSLRISFTSAEAASAKLLIEGYFFGGAGRAYFPLRDPKARCIGIDYAPDWIIVSEQSH